MLKLGLFLAFALCAAGSDVVSLTKDTFDSTIADNDYVLVEFFAPWCGHCKKLAPEYAAAATVLKEDGVVLADVDATIEKDLASKFGVRGYPTLKLFKKGQATEYKGGRTKDLIVSAVRKATGPPAKELSDAASVKAFADDNKVAVVAFVNNADDLKKFESVAEADDKHAFAYTQNAEAATENGVSAPGVVLFKQFDEGKNVFDGEFNQGNIAAFVSKNALPLVIPFSMDVVADIFQSKIGKAVFMLTDTEQAFFNDVAKANQGKFVFTVADSSNARLNDHLGVPKSAFPKLMILETGAQMKKFPLDGDLTAENVQAHLDAYIAGTLKPFFKSEEVPADNDGPVTVIVGKNFDEIVLDEEKDVLLEIYAPWCGHCKKLEPIYNDLGELYKDNKNIVIAKMDGTGNEVDGISIRGFPTIKFYPAGKKTASSGQNYEDNRELSDLKKFIEQNAKNAKQAKEEL